MSDDPTGAGLLRIALAAARFPRSLTADAVADASDIDRMGHRFPGLFAAQLPRFAALASDPAAPAGLSAALAAWAANRYGGPGEAPSALARRLGWTPAAGAVAALALPAFRDLRREDVAGLATLDTPASGALPLSRLFRLLLLGIRLRRPDMIGGFVDGSAASVLDWTLVFGLSDYRLWPLLPEGDRRLLLRGAPGQAPLFLRAVLRFREDLRGIANNSAAIGEWYRHHAFREYAVELDPPAAPAVDPARLALIGPWNRVLGIADDVYSAGRALLHLGHPFEVVDTRPARWIETDPDKRAALGHLAVPAPTGGRALFCDTLFEATMWALSHWPRFNAFARRDLFAPWELPRLPPGWDAAARLFDTILSPSIFAQQAFAAAGARALHATSSVELAPLPAAAARLLLRRRLPLPPRAPVVVTVFDYASWLERKNPLAALRAFAQVRRAVPRAVLVVKTTRARRARGAAARVAQLAARTPGVRCVDGAWPNPLLEALLRRADVLISLHRAEGFGRNIAKALLLGGRVVVTDWSGNADFRAEPGYHGVRYRLRTLSDRDYVLGEGQVWADPDARDAVRALRAAIAAGRPGPRARTKARFGRARLATRLTRALNL